MFYLQLLDWQPIYVHHPGYCRLRHFVKTVPQFLYLTNPSPLFATLVRVETDHLISPAFARR
jgi:hypothetical protein